MNWVEVAAQWLHILLGTFWFGGMLFSTYVVVPAIGGLPVEGRGPAMAAVGMRANRVVPWVALGAIVLGVVRGTVLGDIKSIGDLGSAYGIEWIVSLVAAAASLAWGVRVLNPAAARVAMGPPSPAKAAQMATVRRYALVQIAGFLVIFTAMILMHYANGG